MCAKPAKGGRGAKGSGGNKRKVFLDRIGKIFSLSTQKAERLVSIKLKSSVRINALSPLGREEILSRLESAGVELEPISWCDGAYFLKSEKGPLAESDLFREGHVYIQNASSLVPALALAPKAGDRLLDVCAAPGGKSLHMAALAGGDLDLYANDQLRVKKLENVLAEFHFPSAHLSAHPGQFIDRHMDGGFERILLDAQCSGEGMYNLAHADALKHWSLERVQKMAFLQQKMLAAAWKLLKPGGVLVYSTCTFGPEENEAPLTRHLKHNPDCAVEPIELDIPARTPGLRSWQGEKFHPGMEHAIRIIPHQYMEGFFVCRLRKSA